MLYLPLHYHMTSIDQIDDTDALRQLMRELSQFDPAVKIPAIHRTILLKEKAPRRQLLQALKDQRPDVRAAAAEAVEALQPWITDEQWLETLQENTWQVSFAARNILASLGKDAPLRSLFSPAVLKNRSLRFSTQSILRLKIAQWLPEKQEQFIQFSREQLQRDSSENRVIALEMLGLIDEKVPIDAFLSALNDSEATVRLAALEQLRKRGRQGSTFSIEPLANLLSDPDARVRWASLLALGTQEEAIPINLLIAALHDADEGVIHTAASILSHRRVVQAIPDLLEQLLTTDLNDSSMDDYIEDIFQALYELHAYVPLEPLLNALESETEKVRLRAITVLSLLQERTPVELLLRLLDHKDPAICKQAIWALGRHLMRIPKEAIINKLKDRRREVRQVTSSVLRRTNEDIPTDLLLPFLDGPENIARATAIELLGQRVPVARLITATRDQKWTVRLAAIKVLGTMGEQVPLEVFLEALCDRNLSVRKAALLALGEQGGRTSILTIMDALHDRRRVSEAARYVLEKLGKRVPHALILQALGDPMAHVRRIAIHLLETIEYEEAFPVEMIRGMIQDRDASVREAAILALNQLGAIEPAEPFIAALNDNDDNVRKAALLAVAKLGERAPLEPLKVLLGESKIYESAITCLQETHPEVLREVAEEASTILLGKGAGRVLGSLIQEHVAEVIGNMYHPGPLLVNKLVELLDWPYGNVCRKAEQGLRKLGKEPVQSAE
ncbi:HEAT repeat domain-containing protein [Ktedonobacteria bacterium brp13]|nr:HEAT repeat domain-containing protein [Ktedonobacteria bacterium brp13]